MSRMRNIRFRLPPSLALRLTRSVTEKGAVTWYTKFVVIFVYMFKMVTSRNCEIMFRTEE